MAFRYRLMPSSRPVRQTHLTVVGNVSQTIPMTPGHQRVHASARTVPFRDMAYLEDPGGVMGIGPRVAQGGLASVAVRTR